jgi:hypothetical protein
MIVRYLGFVIAFLAMFQIGTADQSGEILAEDHTFGQAVSAEAEHESGAHVGSAAKANLPNPSGRLSSEPARLNASSGGMGLFKFILTGAVGFLLLAAWVWKSGTFDRFSIANKLYCGFGAAALLTFSVGAINMSSLAETNSKGDLKAAAMNLDVLIVQAHLLHDQFLLVGVGDEEKCQRLLAQHDELFREFDREFATLQRQSLDLVDTRATIQIAKLTQEYRESFEALATTYDGISEFQGRLDRLGELIAAAELITGTNELTEIERLVSALATKASEAQLVEQSITTREIAQNITESSNSAHDLAAGATESAIASKEIWMNMTSADEANRQTSAGAKNTKTASGELSAVSEALASLVAQFKV